MKRRDYIEVLLIAAVVATMVMVTLLILVPP
jgi:hypothetical protein